MFVAGLGVEQQESGASASGSTNATPSFQHLTQTLRHVLTSRRGYPVYDSLAAKRKADYNVILVEKV